MVLCEALDVIEGERKHAEIKKDITCHEADVMRWEALDIACKAIEAQMREAERINDTQFKEDAADGM